jgi:hypothetical protein
MLNPLLSFSDVTVLEVCSFHAFSNTPEKMAIAWRHLQNWSSVDLAGQVNLGCHLQDWSLWCSIAVTWAILASFRLVVDAIIINIPLYLPVSNSKVAYLNLDD